MIRNTLNYAHRYAAICDKYPELKIEELQSNSSHSSNPDAPSDDGIVWSIDEIIIHPKFAHAIVLSRLQEALPSGVLLWKRADGQWVIERVSDAVYYPRTAEVFPTALDAVLAWWEGKQSR